MQTKTWFLLIYGDKLDKWATWKKFIKNKDDLKIFKQLYDNILKDGLIFDTNDRSYLIDNFNIHTDDSFCFKTNHISDIYKKFSLPKIQDEEKRFSRTEIFDMMNVYLIFLQQTLSLFFPQVTIIYSPMLENNSQKINKKLLNDELIDDTAGMLDNRVNINWLYFKSTLYSFNFIYLRDNKWFKEYDKNVHKSQRY